MPRIYSEGRDYIDFLIEDEKEAIEGYDDAMLAIEDPKVIETLTRIRDEEYEHIRELKALKGE